MDRVSDAFFSSEWDTAASSRTSLTQRLPFGSRCHFWRRTTRTYVLPGTISAWQKKGSMSETQFFVILIVAVMAVALLATALTGMFEIERVFEMLPLFEDLIGD
jgi:hypothetical protein